MNTDYWTHICECGQPNHVIPSLKIIPKFCESCELDLPPFNN